MKSLNWRLWLNVIGFVVFWLAFSVLQVLNFLSRHPTTNFRRTPGQERVFKAQHFDLPIVATLTAPLDNERARIRDFPSVESARFADASHHWTGRFGPAAATNAYNV
jgi:hypothetical protein